MLCHQSIISSSTASSSFFYFLCLLFIIIIIIILLIKHIITISSWSSSCFYSSLCSDSTQGSHLGLPLAYWLSSQVFTWPYPLAFLCHLSSSATLTWQLWSFCPASENFYGSDTGLRNYWPCALEPTPSFYTIHFINWWTKCLFSFSQDCSILSGSLALEALLIGVHCKKRYINV